MVKKMWWTNEDVTRTHITQLTSHTHTTKHSHDTITFNLCAGYKDGTHKSLPPSPPHISPAAHTHPTQHTAQICKILIHTQSHIDCTVEGPGVTVKPLIHATAAAGFELALHRDCTARRTPATAATAAQLAFLCIL